MGWRRDGSSKGIGAIVTRELGWIPAFSRCGQEELERVDALACGMRLRVGNELTQAGKPVRQLMVLMDGVVATERPGGELLHPPGFVLGLAELHEGRPAETTATAATDVSLLVFGPAEFAALLEIPGARAGLFSGPRLAVQHPGPEAVGPLVLSPGVVG